MNKLRKKVERCHTFFIFEVAFLSSLVIKSKAYIAIGVELLEQKRWYQGSALTSRLSLSSLGLNILKFHLEGSRSLDGSPKKDFSQLYNSKGIKIDFLV